MQIDIAQFRSLATEFENSIQAAAEAQTAQAIATDRYEKAQREKWAAEDAAKNADKAAEQSRIALDQFIDALAEPEPEPTSN